MLARIDGKELDANDLVLFARVAAIGCFSRAAEQLRMEKSTVSRRIASLDERFGERLLHRSMRKLTLTDFGLSLLYHARALAAENGGRTGARHSTVRRHQAGGSPTRAVCASVWIPSALISRSREWGDEIIDCMMA